MSLAELKATAEWLGWNRLHEHLHLLEGDHRCSWAVRTRQEWPPPIGHAPKVREFVPYLECKYESRIALSLPMCLNQDEEQDGIQHCRP